MDFWKKLAIAALVIFLIDLVWLGLINTSYNAVVESVQGGRPLRARLWAGAVVYVALAFLLLKEETAWEAFSTGAATYAVYDFTVMALFKDYPVWIGAADTVWGGVLFLATHMILKKVGGFY
jgi:uncharacterized membrane protein